MFSGEVTNRLSIHDDTSEKILKVFNEKVASLSKLELDGNIADVQGDRIVDAHAVVTDYVWYDLLLKYTGTRENTHITAYYEGNIVFEEDMNLSDSESLINTVSDVIKKVRRHWYRNKDNARHKVRQVDILVHDIKREFGLEESSKHLDRDRRGFYQGYLDLKKDNKDYRLWLKGSDDALSLKFTSGINESRKESETIEIKPAKFYDFKKLSTMLENVNNDKESVSSMANESSITRMLIKGCSTYSANSKLDESVDMSSKVDSVVPNNLRMSLIMGCSDYKKTQLTQPNDYCNKNTGYLEKTGIGDPENYSTENPQPVIHNPDIKNLVDKSIKPQSVEPSYSQYAPGIFKLIELGVKTGVVSTLGGKLMLDRVQLSKLSDQGRLVDNTIQECAEAFDIINQSNLSESNLDERISHAQIRYLFAIGAAKRQGNKVVIDWELAKKKGFDRYYNNSASGEFGSIMRRGKKAVKRVVKKGKKAIGLSDSDMTDTEKAIQFAFAVGAVQINEGVVSYSKEKLINGIKSVKGMAKSLKNSLKTLTWKMLLKFLSIFTKHGYGKVVGNKVVVYKSTFDEFDISKAQLRAIAQGDKKTAQNVIKSLDKKYGDRNEAASSFETDIKNGAKVVLTEAIFQAVIVVLSWVVERLLKHFGKVSDNGDVQVDTEGETEGSEEWLHEYQTNKAVGILEFADSLKEDDPNNARRRARKWIQENKKEFTLDHEDEGTYAALFEVWLFSKSLGYAKGEKRDELFQEFIEDLGGSISESNVIKSNTLILNCPRKRKINTLDEGVTDTLKTGAGKLRRGVDVLKDKISGFASKTVDKAKKALGKLSFSAFKNLFKKLEKKGYGRFSGEDEFKVDLSFFEEDGVTKSDLKAIARKDKKALTRALKCVKNSPREQNEAVVLAPMLLMLKNILLLGIFYGLAIFVADALFVGVSALFQMCYDMVKKRKHGEEDELNIEFDAEGNAIIDVEALKESLQECNESILDTVKVGSNRVKTGVSYAGYQLKSSVVKAAESAKKAFSKISMTVYENILRKFVRKGYGKFADNEFHLSKGVYNDMGIDNTMIADIARGNKEVLNRALSIVEEQTEYQNLSGNEDSKSFIVVLKLILIGLFYGVVRFTSAFIEFSVTGLFNTLRGKSNKDNSTDLMTECYQGELFTIDLEDLSKSLDKEY